MLSKNVIIYGAAPKGLQVKRYIEKNYDISIKYFCDGNSKKQGKIFDGCRIVSFEQIINEIKEDCTREWSIVITANKIEEIVDMIREKELHVNVFGVNLAVNVVDECLIYPVDISKPRLDYFEYHITYHCNLKCKGCSHFSNISKPEFGDFQQYVKDLYRLKELFWGIRKVRLLGGEPLLNTKLPDFINITREIFPDTDIRVVSNGLLIPKISAEVLLMMKKTYAEFDITQYPPTAEIKEEIEFKCMESNVKYNFSTLVKEFFDIRNDKGDSNADANFSKCISRKCHFLENGKISLCPRPLIFEKFRDDINLERPSMCGDIIDIYDTNLDGFKLMEIFSKPIESCKYCNVENAVFFEWQGNYPKV